MKKKIGPTPKDEQPRVLVSFITVNNKSIKCIEMKKKTLKIRIKEHKADINFVVNPQHSLI